MAILQCAETIGLGGGASAREIMEADAPEAGGNAADRTASVSTSPPSTAASAIFAVRPMSVLAAEPAEAFAPLGLGSGAARRV